MKLLFTHDNRFYRDEKGDIYSNAQFGYSLWKRYLKSFESIDVGARIYELNENIDSKKLILSSGPNVNFINIPNLSNPINKVIRRKEASTIINKLLEENDALIARLPSEIGTLSAKIANESQKKWAVEIVGCPFKSFWYHGNLFGKVYAHYSRYTTKKIISKSKYCLYVTREYLQKEYPTSGISIGVSDVSIKSKSKKLLNLNKHEIGGNEGKVIIGLIGSLSTKLKGIDTAILALRILKDQKLNFELRILGEGNQSHVLGLINKYGMQKEVILCGTKPNVDEVFNWLDEIDIYIQPSLTEGLPRTVIEAMSRGCPIIASDIGGIPELISRECLHKPKDSVKLSELLLKMIQDDLWREGQAKINKESSKLFEEKYLDDRRKDFWEEFKKC